MTKSANVGDSHPTRVGSMIFSLSEPDPGWEVKFHRWWDDHMYSGSLNGPWAFSGRRWIATRQLKSMRFPSRNPIVDPVTDGSFLWTCWITDGHHEEHLEWSTARLAWHDRQGKRFPQRKLCHGTSYMRAMTWYRDPEPVPLDFALDYPYAGLVTMWVERDGVNLDRSAHWLTPTLQSWLSSSSPAASVSSWQQTSLLDQALDFVPKPTDVAGTELLLFMLDVAPGQAWQQITALAHAIKRVAGGQVRLAAGFVPAVPGTLKFVDEI